KSLDLVLVGKAINNEYLEKCLRKAESIIKRDIRCSVLKETEVKSYLRDYPATLLIWEKK
ncbi:MAG: hypothetical protein WCI71_14830, partial [Bacteroidota bacterium]